MALQLRHPQGLADEYYGLVVRMEGEIRAQEAGILQVSRNPNDRILRLALNMQEPQGEDELCWVIVVDESFPCWLSDYVHPLPVSDHHYYRVCAEIFWKGWRNVWHGGYLDPNWDLIRNPDGTPSLMPRIQPRLELEDEPDPEPETDARSVVPQAMTAHQPERPLEDARVRGSVLSQKAQKVKATLGKLRENLRRGPEDQDLWQVVQSALHEQPWVCDDIGKAQEIQDELRGVMRKEMDATRRRKVKEFREALQGWLTEFSLDVWEGADYHGQG